jgi:hypothetical protein
VSHAWAQERINHGPAALSADVLDRLSEYSPQKALEFGSGYSSVFLSRVWGCEYVAFEHSPKWAPQVSPHICGTLFQFPLLACSDESVRKMYAPDGSVKAFIDADWLTVPDVMLDNTSYDVFGRHNAFYSPECLGYIDPEVDFVIVDGPNGKGRNIAFPLLAAMVRKRFMLLIDDCQDSNGYDFIGHMKRLFFAVEVFRTKEIGKECALFKVEAK